MSTAETGGEGLDIGIIGAPMDLGSARRGVDMGPSALRFASLAERLTELGHRVTDFGNVPVVYREAVYADGRDALAAITDCCTTLAEKTADAVRRNVVPLVLGGDHSIAAGSIAGVATAYAERGHKVGVIWLDAHADMNTPESSESGNVHGMPLAHLLGHGDARLAGVAHPSPAVSARHVAIVGLRDLDAAEREHIRSWGVSAFTMRDVDEQGLRAVMRRAIDAACDGTAGFHLSVDADWVDPVEAPGVGTPVKGGATFREAHLAMELAHESGKLLAVDFVEVNPILDIHNRTGELGVDLIASAFGLRVLDRGRFATE
ncbi:MAG: arginase [Gemmatimonadota bacterium]|nr:arginase [Gemmatimonadota bacterium]